MKTICGLVAFLGFLTAFGIHAQGSDLHVEGGDVRARVELGFTLWTLAVGEMPRDGILVALADQPDQLDQADQAPPQEEAAQEETTTRRRARPRSRRTAEPTTDPTEMPEAKPATEGQVPDTGKPDLEPAVEFAVEGTPIPDPPPHFERMDDRWAIVPPEYEINDPSQSWNSYYQNRLKGDYPIIGEDIFLNLTLTDRSLFEGRNVPTPSGITGASSSNAEFFGGGEQFLFQNYLILEADLFKGQQAFKPVDWRVKVAVAYNTTYVDVEETGVVNVDVTEGTDRYSDYVALQEALIEKHLFDLTDRYDFLAIEAGILPFRSDFRGFIFDDVNLGARLFGNYDSNKWQYNFAVFNMLEKDTNSELNRLRDRDQVVVIANVFRQDWPFLGYTPSLSFHYSHEDETVEFDRNGFLVRPAAVGIASPHEIDAYYIGFTGEGHIGPVNVTHAFYQVLGHDDDNPLAGRDTDINAQFAALELSYDIDWWRPRLFGMFASGDDDTRDGQAEGFDAIMDAPNFAGGGLSFFNRQAIGLLGVNLTQRLSPLVDLSTSKFQGQSNFVNPGLMVLGGAVDAEITPTLRAQLGASYMLFVDTDPLETFLQTEDIDEELGAEIFFGLQWRPFLTNQLIFNLGASPFFPGEGFKKMYQSSETLFSAFLETTVTW